MACALRMIGMPGSAAHAHCSQVAWLLAILAITFPSYANTEDAANAKAFDAAALLREVQSAVDLTKGLKVSASKSTLRDGEPLVLTIEVPRAGYLNVVSVNPAGEPTVLFPNQSQPENHVEAGRFTFPTAQMTFEIRASAPYGESRIAAFLSTEKLNLYMNGDGDRTAAGALLARVAGLSTAGRDLINLLTNRTLQGDSKVPPLVAGMTTVLSCAPVGPCTAETGPPAGIRRIVDAIVPGIFLDKDVDIPASKGSLRAVSERGVTLTKVSEGFVPRLYQDSAGYCTIAYGHLVRLGGCSAADQSRYSRRMTEAAGNTLLLADMALAQRAVSAYVTVPLTEGQYAGLVDFTYNVGAGNLKRSTLLKVVNAKEHHRVPEQFKRWTRAGGRELRGLRIRRDREIALFFEGAEIPKTEATAKGEEATAIDIRVGER
jgi:lysozyme